MTWLKKISAALKCLLCFFALEFEAGFAFDTEFEDRLKKTNSSTSLDKFLPLKDQLKKWIDQLGPKEELKAARTELKKKWHQCRKLRWTLRGKSFDAFWFKVGNERPTEFIPDNYGIRANCQDFSRRLDAYKSHERDLATWDRAHELYKRARAITEEQYGECKSVLKSTMEHTYNLLTPYYAGPRVFLPTA